MNQIRITRDPSGKVTFKTVSIDVTENVFFTNLDPQQAHWPTLATNQVGPAPSANSSQCPVPPPQVTNPSPPPPTINQTPPYTVTYKCQIPGHQNEQGVINVFAVLAAGTTTLAAAIKGTPITRQQLVVGGMSPYTISNAQFQIKDSNNNVIQSGPGIGPGLQLTGTTDNTGVWVTGTPTVSGTYNFSFVVNDNMGGNLQQVQYTMKVA
ncbi:MAG TPA: hypothetical protein VIW64_00270 [Pyrinomonadaceae bacterium]